MRRGLYYALSRCNSIKEVRLELASREYPKELRALSRQSWLSTRFMRLLGSTLVVTRAIRLPPIPNLETITRPPKGQVSCYREKAKEFWKTLGYDLHEQQVPRSVRWKSFHPSTKAGPNGQAMWSSFRDFTVLPLSLIDDLFVVGGSKLTEKLTCLRNHVETLTPIFGNGKSIRKISCIPDKEGKTREVAMLDYWSQTCLRPLHKYLFKALKKIRQDVTFSQGSFKDLIDGHEGPFHSVDLSAATDRFPIELICQLLEVRFGSEYSSSWKNIMVGFPFDSPHGKISYSVGNPMGAYSSWNSFALAHHFVMFICCENLMIPWKEAKYVILGDDVVIYDTLLYHEYVKLITSLGIDYAPDKGFNSDTLYEFAKRIIWRGEEITPFPVNALWETRNNPVLALNVISQERFRGWEFPSGIPKAMSDLFERTGMPRRYRRKRSDFLQKAFAISEGLRGLITAEEALKPFLVDNGTGMIEMISFFRPDFYQEVFSRCIQQSFAESVEGTKFGRPLGELAQQLVIFITSLDICFDEQSDLIQSIPILRIHGEIEEMYLETRRAMNPVNLFINSDNRELRELHRVLAIPMSDAYYYVSNQEIVITAASKLVSLIDVEMLKMNLSLSH